MTGQQFAVTLQRGDASRLEERQDALGHGLDDARLALLHLPDVHGDVRRLDPVRSELLVSTVIKLSRLQQRLGGNAPRVQARAAEGADAIRILPLVDTGDAEFVLTGTDRGGIARGTAADDNDIERVGHGELHWRLLLLIMGTKSGAASCHSTGPLFAGKNRRSACSR